MTQYLNMAKAQEGVVDTAFLQIESLYGFASGLGYVFNNGVLVCVNPNIDRSRDYMSVETLIYLHNNMKPSNIVPNIWGGTYDKQYWLNDYPRERQMAVERKLVKVFKGDYCKRSHCFMIYSNYVEFVNKKNAKRLLAIEWIV